MKPTLLTPLQHTQWNPPCHSRTSTRETLKHNFGHGQVRQAMFNLLAFAFHSVLDCLCDLRRQLRDFLVFLAVTSSRTCASPCTCSSAHQSRRTSPCGARFPARPPKCYPVAAAQRRPAPLRLALRRLAPTPITPTGPATVRIVFIGFLNLIYLLMICNTEQRRYTLRSTKPSQDSCRNGEKMLQKTLRSGAPLVRSRLISGNLPNLLGAQPTRDE